MRAIVLLITYYGCVLYALVNPAWGVLFFIHITIFRPDALVWGNLAFGRLHLITSLSVLVGFFLAGKFSTSEKEVGGNFQATNIGLFLLFILWLVVVSAFAEYSPELSFEKTQDVVKIFILCFLFASLIKTEAWLNAYVWVVVLSFGLLAFWGILQGLAGNDRLDTLWPGGSNYIAAQLALVAPLALAKTFDEAVKLKYRVLFLACFTAIILACMYTNSRGGFIGLIAGLIVFLTRVKTRMKVLVVSLLVGVLVLQWIPSNFSHRISSIFAEQDERDESANSRNVLWQIAWRIWQDHPITGVGLENFSPVKESYADKVGDIVTSEKMYHLIFNQKRYPHGLYPGMMAEMGIVGTAIFLGLLLRNILCRLPGISPHPLYLQAKGAQAGLIGFAVAATFGDFQYIEILYLQLFFVGAVRTYYAQLSDSLVEAKLLKCGSLVPALRESRSA
jgi:probable O-glycosylation ligase (exosortase A-associated)